MLGEGEPVHGSTPRCMSEAVDCFAVSYLLLPQLELSYERWKQIVLERYCCFVAVGEDTFTKAKDFTAAIIQTDQLDTRRFLSETGLARTFKRITKHNKPQRNLSLLLLEQWVRFVRYHEVEAKLM